MAPLAQVEGQQGVLQNVLLRAENDHKEQKYCRNPEDLECNEDVKLKTKEYIKKYMQKFGAVYKP